MFQKLVKRGHAVMREWNIDEGMDANDRLLVAELGAAILTLINGERIREWEPSERKKKATMIRIALTAALQIGRSKKPKRVIV